MVLGQPSIWDGCDRWCLPPRYPVPASVRPCAISDQTRWSLPSHSCQGPDSKEERIVLIYTYITYGLVTRRKIPHNILWEFHDKQLRISVVLPFPIVGVWELSWELRIPRKYSMFLIKENRKISVRFTKLVETYKKMWGTWIQHWSLWRIWR